MHASKLSKRNHIEPEFEEHRKRRTKQLKVWVEPKESPNHADGKISKSVNAEHQPDFQV